MKNDKAENSRSYEELLAENRELRLQLQQALEASAAKETFLSNMSHDTRTGLKVKEEDETAAAGTRGGACRGRARKHCEDDLPQQYVARYPHAHERDCRHDRAGQALYR